MPQTALYMLLLGCKPQGRNIEQHDLFFSIGESLKSLAPSIVQFWPEAAPKIHIDAWRQVNTVDGYDIRVVPKQEAIATATPLRLFFINLGGYKENEFEEFHYKILAVAPDKATAIRQAKTTAFFKHANAAHVDDKYGVDVDDIYAIEEILPQHIKQQYSISITRPTAPAPADELHMGYFKLDELPG